MGRRPWQRVAPWGSCPRPVLAVALVAVLIASVPSLLHRERACAPDSGRYLWLGRGLVEDARFANADGTPHAGTPPLYPLLTGVAQAVATALGVRAPLVEGCECPRAHPVILALVLAMQCGLFLGSVHSLYRLCLRAGLDAPRAGGVAVIYALSPLPLLYVGRVLSETLYVSLVLAGCDRFFLAAQRRDEARARWWRPALSGGVLLGLAALTRAALTPWILLWPVIWLLAGKGRAVVAVAGLALLLSTSPWLLRNYRCFGAIGWNPGTGTVDFIGELAGTPGEYAAAVADARAGAPAVDPFSDGRLRDRVVARLIAAHPLRFAQRSGRSFLGLWAPPVTDLLQSAGLWRQSAGTLAHLREQGAGAAAQRVWERIRSNAAEAGRSGAALWATLSIVALMSFADMLVTACGLAGLVLLLVGLRSAKRDRPPSKETGRAAWFPRPSGLALAFLGTLVLVLVVVPIGIHHPRFRVPLSPGLAFLAQPLLSAGWRNAGIATRALAGRSAVSGHGAARKEPPVPQCTRQPFDGAAWGSLVAGRLEGW